MMETDRAIQRGCVKKFAGLPHGGHKKFWPVPTPKKMLRLVTNGE